MHEEILLSGNDWGLFQFKPGDGKKEGVHEKDFWHPASPSGKGVTWPYGLGWLRADVPGDVHSTLVKRKIISDPYIGLDNEKCRSFFKYVRFSLWHGFNRPSR